MKQVTADNFGLVIAYLLPGFVALWGLRPVLPDVDRWLAAPPDSAPTVGGFLCATLGATAAGLFVSTVRWAVVDRLYHATGIPAPAWDFAKLPANLAAFESHVQDHYRYYQSYANTMVATAFAYALGHAAGSPWPGPGVGWAAAISAVLVVLALGSRDALRKYYARTAALLAPGVPRRAGRTRSPG